MTEMFDVSKRLQSAIAEYCAKRCSLGLCENEDDCEFCPVDEAYHQARADAFGSKKYKVKNISYHITPEDVDLDEDDFALRSDYLAACTNKINEIIENLPSELIVSVSGEDFDTGTDDELDDILTDIVSDETGFLVESFEYDEVDE